MCRGVFENFFRLDDIEFCLGGSNQPSLLRWLFRSWGPAFIKLSIGSCPWLYILHARYRPRNALCCRAASAFGRLQCWLTLGQLQPFDRQPFVTEWPQEDLYKNFVGALIVALKLASNLQAFKKHRLTTLASLVSTPMMNDFQMPDAKLSFSITTGNNSTWAIITLV